MQNGLLGPLGYQDASSWVPGVFRCRGVSEAKSDIRTLPGDPTTYLFCRVCDYS